MFGFDQTAVKIAAAFIIAVLLFSFGYYKGHTSVQVKFDQYKAEVQAAADQQAKETAQINAKNQKLFQETKNAYNAQLASLRAYYQLRNNQGSSTMPGSPNAAAGTAAKTTYDLPALPPIDTLASQCAETTLTLVQLQKWVQDAQ